MSRTITVTGSLFDLCDQATLAGFDVHTFSTEHGATMGAVLRFDGRDVGGIQRNPTSAFGDAVCSIDTGWCPLERVVELLTRMGR